MLRLIIFISILFIFINSCSYPDIDDIPENIDLEVTYEDKKNIEKLKKEVEEINE